MYFFINLIISFHSSEVFLGGVPNSKKRVIITTSKNFEIKLALLLKMAVAQLVIGNDKIEFRIVSLSCQLEFLKFTI